MQISHLKASGRDNWDKMERALRMIEEGRDPVALLSPPTSIPTLLAALP